MLYGFLRWHRVTGHPSVTRFHFKNCYYLKADKWGNLYITDLHILIALPFWTPSWIELFYFSHSSTVMWRAKKLILCIYPFLRSPESNKSGFWNYVYLQPDAYTALQSDRVYIYLPNIAKFGSCDLKKKKNYDFLKIGFKIPVHGKSVLELF